MSEYRFSIAPLSTRLFAVVRAAKKEGLLTEVVANQVEADAKAIQLMEITYPKTVCAWRVVAVGVCDLERFLGVVDDLRSDPPPYWEYRPEYFEDIAAVDTIRLGLQLDEAEKATFETGFGFRFDFYRYQAFVAAPGNNPRVWVPLHPKSTESYRDATIRTMAELRDGLNSSITAGQAHGGPLQRV